MDPTGEVILFFADTTDSVRIPPDNPPSLAIAPTLLMHETIAIETAGQGLHEITDRIAPIVASGSVHSGVCTVFVQHTSASLLIQENADPSARRDLEQWIQRHVPEGDPAFTHTAEGPDDMPAHIRAALTATSLTIPIIDRRLALGTWQGVYLWEHRHRPHRRQIIVSLIGSG